MRWGNLVDKIDHICFIFIEAKLEHTNTSAVFSLQVNIQKNNEIKSIIYFI